MYTYTKKHTCNTVYLNVECSIHMYTMNIQKGRLQKSIGVEFSFCLQVGVGVVGLGYVWLQYAACTLEF